MRTKRIPTMDDPIKCEKCRTPVTLAKPTDIDGSFKELLAAGWMHFALSGRGQERWTWKCPTCKPQGMPTSYGLSTGMFSPSKR